MTQLLDEDRMTRMRSTVLGAVDEDARRRGTKMRRRLGVGSAAAVLLVVGTVGVSLITPDSGGGDAGADFSSAATARDSGGVGELDSAAAAPQDSGTEEIAPQEVREVIVTGSADLVVKDPRGVSAKIATWVEGHGGRVDAREVYDTDDSAHAALTLRIPADRVTEALDQLETYGDVTDVSVSKDDVTSSARDLDARIKALRISIERLEGILAKANSNAEVVTAEQALTDRQSQVEQLISQRNQLSEQVSLATLTVNVSSHEKTSSVDPGGFRGGLKNGWNALVDVVNNVVEGIGTALPWLGVLIVLYGGYRLARGAVRRRG